MSVKCFIKKNKNVTNYFNNATRHMPFLDPHFPKVMLLETTD